jgi:hypothetical protein
VVVLCICIGTNGSNSNMSRADLRESREINQESSPMTTTTDIPFHYPPKEMKLLPKKVKSLVLSGVPAAGAGLMHKIEIHRDRRLRFELQ